MLSIPQGRRGRQTNFMPAVTPSSTERLAIADRLQTNRIGEKNDLIRKLPKELCMFYQEPGRHILGGFSMDGSPNRG